MQAGIGHLCGNAHCSSMIRKRQRMQKSWYQVHNNCLVLQHGWLQFSTNMSAFPNQRKEVSESVGSGALSLTTWSLPPSQPFRKRHQGSGSSSTGWAPPSKLQDCATRSSASPPPQAGMITDNLGVPRVTIVIFKICRGSFRGQLGLELLVSQRLKGMQ